MAITAADLQVKLSTSGAGQVKSDLAGIGRAVDDTGQRGSRMGSTLATAFRWGIIGAFTGAVIGATSAVGDFIMGASNLSEAQSKVNVVYGQSATTINKWAKTTSRAFGITETAALDTAGTFGNLFTNMGFTQDAAAGMSMTVTELSADMSSFFNVSQPQVIDAMTSAFVGEYDALQRLGVPINAAAVEQFALNNGIWDGVDAMTDAERAQAVYGLVLESTTNAQGDFARTSGETANQMRILSASFSELGTRIGSVLLPAANALVGWAIDAVDYFGALGDAFGAGGLSAVVDQLAADIGNIIIDIPSVTVRILGWTVQTVKSLWQGILDWWNGGTQVVGGATSPGQAVAQSITGGGGQVIEIPSVPVRIMDWAVEAFGDLPGKIREKVIGLVMGGDSGGDGTGGGTYGGITIEDAIKVQITDWAVDLMDTDHNGDITLGEVQQAVDNALEGIIGVDIEIQDAKIKIVNPGGDLTLADVQGWVDTALEGIIGVDIEIQDAKIKIDNPTNDLTLMDVQGWVDEAMEGMLGVDIEIQDLNFGFGKINLDPAFDAIAKAVESVKSKWNAIKDFDLSAPDISWPDAPSLSDIPFVSDLIALFGDIGDLFSNTQWSFSIGAPDIDWPNPMDLVPQDIRDFVSDPWGWVKDHLGGEGDNDGSLNDDEPVEYPGIPASGSSGMGAFKQLIDPSVTAGIDDLRAKLQDLQTVAGGIGPAFDGISQAVSGAMTGAASAAQTGVNQIIVALANGGVTAANALQNALAPLPSMVAAVGARASAAALVAGLQIAQNFRNGAALAPGLVAAALSGVAGAVSAAGGRAAGAALAAGINIGQALAAGILSQIGAVRSAAAALGAAATVGTSKQLEITSPSKVFMQLGQYVGEGFALGMDSMQSTVAASGASLLSVPSVGGFGGNPYAMNGGAGGGVTYVVNVTVEGNVTTEDAIIANATQRIGTAIVDDIVRHRTAVGMV